MRFVSLEVAWFQGVRAARLEFGPGLNVLHGPNDLGKSTLATAIRAALLLPTTSTEAEAFHPWHADQKASVELVFLDDAGRFWRVKKVFGSPTGAQLWFSKDGQAWTSDARGREVDGKLRTLLPWGIPSPGGKGAPKGLPRSFLTNALLGLQSDVAGILRQGLDGDAADTGRLELTRALSALAQDPLFKQVLDVAQGEFERFFTEKGRRKTGQASSLTAASEAVKALQAELEQQRRELDQAQGLEERARQLREQRAEVAHRLELAHARRLEAMRGSCAALQAEADSRQAALAAARQARVEAAEALRAAEAAERQVASEHGAERRALERARLERTGAELREEQGRLEAQLEKAAAALQAQAALASARAEVARLEGVSRQRAGAQEQARQALASVEEEVKLAEGIVAYGRWQQAVDAAAGAATARAEAARLGGEALSREVTAQQAEARARAAEEEAARRQATLPSEAQLATLERLAQDKAVAEAALGGGVTVAVRPARPLALHAVADDGAPEEVLALKVEKVLEADRRLRLSIGDLVELEVTAGAPERRRTAEALRRRWKEEALPALAAAGGASLADLHAGAAAVRAQLAAAVEARAAARAARVEAEALRSRAAALERQAAPSREELAEREARIGPLDRGVLAGFFASMGASWETQCESLRAQKGQALVKLRATAAQLEGEQREAGALLAAARAREAELAALPALGPGVEAPADARARLGKALEANAAARARGEEALRALEAGTGAALEAARKAVAAAAAAVEARGAEVPAAEVALAEASARLHARQGEARALEAQLPGPEVGGTPRHAASGQVKPVDPAAADAALAAADAEVRAAQAALESARDEAAAADGALTSQGGPAARDRVRQLEEALQAAQARERELQVDADSWKLLRDALREAEKTESAHLGRALAVPVARRFAALTGARYAGVALDQELRVEGVQLPGTQAAGSAVLEALSVGTRDQLATLVRLAVASQLKTAIVLDDQLVHTDVARLDWFREVLRAVAEDAQVLVFTCRPLDYLTPAELPGAEPTREAGAVRAVDLARVVESGPPGPRPP